MTYANLIAQCSIHGGASDDDDRALFSSSDVIEHPQDGILLIKHDDPRSSLLVLRLNDITNSRVWTRLCYILRQNTSMENLTISGNNSHPVSAFWTCVGIQTNTSIKVLSMSDIRLGGPTQLNILADFLVGNPRLEKLMLKHCHLGPADIDCLSEKLMGRSYHSLEKLDLSGNLIGDNSLDRLVMTLNSMRSVKQLNLGSNDMGEKGVISLARLLRSRVSTIEELDISNNNICVESVLRLLNSLRSNNTLKRLDMYDNPMTDEEWTSIFQRVLQIVLHSNHALSSLGTHRGDPSHLRRRRRFRRDPMRELCIRCLGGDQAQLLHASFCVNYKAETNSFKARHKILWSHARGDFNLGEAVNPSIDAGVMPQIFALIGNDSQCELCHRASANLIQYQDETPPRPVLDTIRLNSIYRILQVRPELCSQLDELRFCRRELTHVENKNTTLQLEIERLRRKVSPHDTHKPMIDKIRKLLVINAEIFGRSLSSMDEVCTDIEENGKATLSRYSFDVIHVNTGRKIQFTTEANCSSRTFDLKPLSQLPPGLEDFLALQYKSAPFSKFINHDAIAKIVLMFREDILAEVLPKLKDYLEAVRVCLREIDKWLMEPNVNHNFIETTFGIKLSTPNRADFVGGACACLAGTHHKSYICLQCQCPLSYHKEGRCPKGNTVFHCKKQHILKTISTPNASVLPEYGHIKKSFEIGKKNEQLRLQKNLDFMSRSERPEPRKPNESSTHKRAQNRGSRKLLELPRDIVKGDSHNSDNQSLATGVTGVVTEASTLCTEESPHPILPKRVQNRGSRKLVELPRDIVKGDKRSSDNQSLATGVVTEASTLCTEGSQLDVKQPPRRGRFWGNLYKRKTNCPPRD